MDIDDEDIFKELLESHRETGVYLHLIAVVVEKKHKSALSNAALNVDAARVKQRIIYAQLPDWTEMSFFKQHDVDYFTVKYLTCLSEIYADTIDYEPKISRQLWIYEKPFARGMLRYAYPAVLNLGYDDRVMLNCVVKESAFTDACYNTLKFQENLLEIQVIAGFLAHKFGQVYKSGAMSLRFLEVDLVRVKETGVFYSIEEYVEGVFYKWTNNEGYVNESEGAHLLNAFSHWSFEFTREYLIVTDLQGFFYKKSEYILTDPAILCAKDGKRFGPTNLGAQGIRHFFESHQCNKICSELGLRRNVHQFVYGD